MKTIEEQFEEQRKAIDELKEAFKDTILYKIIIKILDFSENLLEKYFYK